MWSRPKIIGQNKCAFFETGELGPRPPASAIPGQLTLPKRRWWRSERSYPRTHRRRAPNRLPKGPGRSSIRKRSSVGTWSYLSSITKTDTTRTNYRAFSSGRAEGMSRDGPTLCVGLAVGNEPPKQGRYTPMQSNLHTSSGSEHSFA